VQRCVAHSDQETGSRERWQDRQGASNAAQLRELSLAMEQSYYCREYSHEEDATTSRLFRPEEKGTTTSILEMCCQCNKQEACA
jgi:hypothetical protein